MLQIADSELNPTLNFSSAGECHVGERCSSLRVTAVASTYGGDLFRSVTLPKEDGINVVIRIWGEVELAPDGYEPPITLTSLGPTYYGWEAELWGDWQDRDGSLLYEGGATSFSEAVDMVNDSIADGWELILFGDD